MGNPYQWSLKELTEEIRKTQSIDKDFLIVIDGLTGSGKSTCGIHICKKGSENFKIKENVIFSQDELIKQIMEAEKGSFILLDEAINVLFKRDFMKKKQKFVLRLLDMCRDRNLCMIFCVPNFWALDKHILDGRVRLRIHIARTGFAFMWKPTANPFTPDKWCRKYNEKVCYNWDSYPNAKRTKGFIGYLKFPDLSEKDKKIYLETKAKKKEEVRRKEEEEEKREQEERNKGFVMGETMVLSMLKEQGLLKRGALNIYASIRGENAGALIKRVQRHKGKIGQDKQDIPSLYTITSNQEEMEELQA